MLVRTTASVHSATRLPHVSPDRPADWFSAIRYALLGGSSTPFTVERRPFERSSDAAPTAASSYPRSQAQLIVAAESADERAFTRAATGIDWSRSSSTQFAQAVGLALTAGAYLLARNLATQGAALHPDDRQLEKLARLLAPPRVINAELPANESVRPNQAWLRDNGSQYQGQWVALRQGALLAAGPSARQVRDSLESTEGVMLTRVF
jgi:hypothetical protein